MDGVDERALMVRLHDPQLGVGLVGFVDKHFVDLGQRPAAVDFRLALPEQVEVGAVEDEDAHGGGLLGLVNCRSVGQSISGSMVRRHSSFVTCTASSAAMTAAGGTSSRTKTSPMSWMSTKRRRSAFFF